MLRSLVVQLLEGHPYCTAYIYDTYFREGLSPSITQLRSILRFLLDVIQSVIIVIDGVDKLPESDQDRFFSEFLSFPGYKSSNKNCRILISSRDTELISSRIGKWLKVHLSREHSALNASIQMFISDQLEVIRAPFWDLDIDNSTMIDLQRELLEKADG